MQVAVPCIFAGHGSDMQVIQAALGHAFVIVNIIVFVSLAEQIPSIEVLLDMKEPIVSGNWFLPFRAVLVSWAFVRRSGSF